MTELSPEQWEWLEEKYGKLLHHIAYRIGGDAIINGHEDSYQDLCIAMLDTVNAFDGKTPDSFDEYKSSRGFDKYIKTVLWNRKNHLGTKIKRRGPLLKKVTINEQLIKCKVIHPVESAEPFGNEELDDDLVELRDAIDTDRKNIKPSGGVNVNRLCRTMNKPKGRVAYTIARLKKKLKDYQEDA